MAHSPGGETNRQAEPNAYLAVALDDEVVLLDPGRASLILLDPWAARVWRACEHHASEAALAALGPRGRVRKTIRHLAGAGVIRHTGARWAPASVRWIPR